MYILFVNAKTFSPPRSKHFQQNYKTASNNNPEIKKYYIQDKKKKKTKVTNIKNNMRRGCI